MKTMQESSSTPDIINKKLEHYCAYQERCTKDVVSKLKDWNIKDSQIDLIVKKLKEENFLNEERFAKAYARGKFRANKWGRQKIAFELHLKNIPGVLIQAGLREIDDKEYQDVLTRMIVKKKQEIKPEKNLNVREKIITFVNNKGYEMNMILDILNELKI